MQAKMGKYLVSQVFILSTVLAEPGTEMEIDRSSAARPMGVETDPGNLETSQLIIWEVDVGVSGTYAHQHFNPHQDLTFLHSFSCC